MLLKCKHEGCKLHLHALCAEILDRLRVVENNGERDVISYKCTFHSYEDLDACGVCKLSNKQSSMLECDKCSQGYHMACLEPPLTDIPEGDWFCSKCVTAPAEDSSEMEAASVAKESPTDTSESSEDDEGDDPPPGYTAMDF